MRRAIWHNAAPPEVAPHRRFVIETVTLSTDLTTGPVAGHLRRQALPMAMGLVAIISFDLVDLFFVSLLGDRPLAAISFTFPIIWLLSSIIIGFEAGAASCISRAIGKNDAAMAFFQALASYALLRSREEDGSRWLRLCVLFTALSFSIKYRNLLYKIF